MMTLLGSPKRELRQREKSWMALGFQHEQEPHHRSGKVRVRNKSEEKCLVWGIEERV